MKSKSKAKEIAQELYVDAMLSNEEIAELTKVSARTLTTWIAEGKWKQQRALRATTAQDTEADILEILADCAKRRKESTSATERVAIADEASKWNKILENTRRDNRLSLRSHVQVMKDFLAFTNTRDPKFIGPLTLLQKQYITHKSAEYL